MLKPKINVRQLVDKYQTNCNRITEIADLCQKESRERTESENEEFKALNRENQLLSMRLSAAAAEHLRENPDATQDAVKIIRENASRGAKTELIFMRDTMMVSDIKTGGIVPLNIQDILQPLTEGFILDKVGLPMPTGLSGDFVWPMYEMVEAQIAGEGVALSDKKIPFSKMTASPERVGIAIPVSNQTLNQSQGVIEMIVRQIMPQAIKMLLNTILFSTTKVNNATNLVGPFVGNKTTVTLSAIPTFTELNSKMKAKVLESGIDGQYMCWTMTKSMQAILEGTPINKDGVFVPMVQNGMLCGLPIYTTNCMHNVEKSYQKYVSGKWSAYTLLSSDKVAYQVYGDTVEHAVAEITAPAANDIAEVSVITENIGLGDWRYQPMGLFGTLRFIVDPYSQARKDSVDFVLNADYATKTIRPEAFSLGQVSVSK